MLPREIRLPYVFRPVLTHFIILYIVNSVNSYICELLLLNFNNKQYFSFTAEGTEITEFSTTHMMSTEEEFQNLTSTQPTPSTTSVPSKEGMPSDVPSSTLESEQMFPTTKGIRRIDETDMTTIPTSETPESVTDKKTNVTDWTSASRVPKITDVPEDMFTTVRLSTTGRPIFYPKRPVPGEGKRSF